MVGYKIAHAQNSYKDSFFYDFGIRGCADRRNYNVSHAGLRIKTPETIPGQQARAGRALYGKDLNRF